MANDLQELAQLLQLSNLAQQPQIEQQRLQQQNHAANVASVLQLLGLTQQGQQQTNRLDFERQSQKDLLAHQGQQEQQGQDNAQKAYDLEVMKSIGPQLQGGQKLNPELEAIYRTMSPKAENAIDQYHTDRAVSQYNTGQAGYNSVYNNAMHPSSGPTHPEALQAYTALQGIEPSAATWFQQNAESQPAPAPAQHWWNSVGSMFGGSQGPTGGATAPQPTTPNINVGYNGSPGWDQVLQALGSLGSQMQPHTVVPSLPSPTQPQPNWGSFPIPTH